MQYLYAVKALYQKTFFALLLSIILLLNSCGTTETETGGCHNKILFTSSRSGKNQLYMMNPDGTNITQITSGEYSHSNGRWSPDASMIVCKTDDSSSTAGMRMLIINLDGTKRKLLTKALQMCWSPDGSEIIFTYAPLEVGIYDINLYSTSLNGKNIKKLIAGGGYPDFSPDGNSILFTSVGTTNSPQLTIIDYPDLLFPKAIGPVSAGYAAWSPKQNEIACAYKDSLSNKSNIFLINTDGSNFRSITDNITNEGFYLPRWSPDGEKIIFISNANNGLENSYLYMVNRDGTNLHKVTDDDFITSCDWSK